jgi:dTDP-4-amino-4,6-dideoxygalactose transaminase
MQKIPYFQPNLPPLEEYMLSIKGIWDNRILSNTGPLVRSFEAKVAELHGITELIAVSSCTAGLTAALRALSLRGEVITTSFTFIGTIRAIVEAGCTPVYADVCSITGNLDPSKVESLISRNTVAIMPVHCFGEPCDLEAFANIRKSYDVPVIYDAAHCFGVVTEGDISVVSFHATKVLSTGEGGGVFVSDPIKRRQIREYCSFGIDSNRSLLTNGFNFKMSEINAAMGLTQMNHYRSWLSSRKKISDHYKRKLSKISGIRCFDFSAKSHNYAYFPLELPKDVCVQHVVASMFAEGIEIKHYFGNHATQLWELTSPLKGRLKNSFEMANRIICLPIYADMTITIAEQVVQSLLVILKNRK